MGSTLLMRNGSMMVRGMLFSGQRPATSRHFHRVFRFLVRHGGGAIEFVPGEWLARNRSLHGLEQDNRKKLPVGKSLQPHLAEQPRIFTRVWRAAFQCECNG